MLDILKLLTFTWLAFWAFHAGIHIMRGNYQSILPVIIVHFALAGLPLALDIFVGQPRYQFQPGFRLAAQDTWTNIIYCFYVGAIPLFWWFFGRSKKPLTLEIDNALTGSQFSSLKKANWLWHILLYLPLISVLFAPNPNLYLNYAWFIVGSESDDANSFHTLLSLFCTLAILGATILITLAPKLKFSTILYLTPWIVLAIWLHGKRDIIVMTFAMLTLALWYRGFIKRFDVVVVGLVAASLLLIFSSAYQSSVRSVSGDNFWRQYEGFRVDFGRDDVIKMTIFAELYPERMKILEFRGQSLLFYLSMYVPRDMWVEKPFPYATYVTSAMLQIYPPRLLGWGMTTSWLEEAIANFSWAGLLFGPLLPALICRAGDRRSNVFLSCLTVLVSIRFLMVALVAFAPFFWLWLFMIIRIRPVQMRMIESQRDESHHRPRTALPNDAG